MRPLGNNESGMAMLVVLAVVAVLLAAGLELAKTTGRAALATAAETEQYLALEKARAGLHLAMALLASDTENSETDSLQEDWARPERLAVAVAAMEMDGLTLEIRDELGKLQVNALLRQYPGAELNPDQLQIWENFLTPLAGDEETTAALNCLKDWLDDRDDEAVTGVSGAESDHYLSLDRPYNCGNGPLTHLSELFLIKGISPDLFTPEEGPSVDPHDTVTVHGIDIPGAVEGRFRYAGRININTAPEAVIRALLPPDKAELASDLVAYREAVADDAGGFTNSLDKGWVGQVIDLSEDEQKALDRVVRYDSDLFRVVSRASAGNTRMTISALIRRTRDKTSGKWSCRILNLRRSG